MTQEEFNEIISKQYNFTKTDELNYLGNKECYQARFNSKNNENNHYYEWLIQDLNFSGNAVYTNKQGDRNLAALYYFNIFTKEQWEDLIPQIEYREFNKDFDELTEKVVPLFRHIKEFYDDLHLEIWQGIFSYKSHWATANKKPEDQINSKKNGKLYCDTLLQIYPYFKEFLDKWPCGQFTLFRFAQAVGYGVYKGILYDDLKEL